MKKVIRPSKRHPRLDGEDVEIHYHFYSTIKERYPRLGGEDVENIIWVHLHHPRLGGEEIRQLSLSPRIISSIREAPPPRRGRNKTIKPEPKDYQSQRMLVDVDLHQNLQQRLNYLRSSNALLHDLSFGRYHLELHQLKD